MADITEFPIQTEVLDPANYPEFVGPTGETGPQGAQGPQGEPGSDATVTSANIIAALGYTPADEAVLGDIQAALNAINGV